MVPRYLLCAYTFERKAARLRATRTPGLVMR